MSPSSSSGRLLVVLVISLALGALVMFITLLALVGQGSDLLGGKRVARIDIQGPIVSAADTIEDIKKFREDDRVAAILVRIDSPGGAVSPSQDIHAELLKTRERYKKKVVVSIGSLGASGGYYIACAADRIYASPGSLVGSIGVLLELTRIEELMKKVGVASEVVKSGPYKDIASPLRKMTPEERTLLQGVIDETQRQFVGAVASGRHLTEEQVLPLADGRIFTGTQAREHGLLDELGTYEDALEGAARLGGIEGKPQVIKTRKKTGWKKLLAEATSAVRDSLPGAESPGLLYLWRP